MLGGTYAAQRERCYRRREATIFKQAALWTYIATFAVLSVLAGVDDEVKETATERGLDILLSTVTLVGLVAYAVRLAAPTLIHIWKAVAPLILIGYLIQLASAWPELVAADPELTAREQFYIVSVVLAVFTLFLVPAIVINFRFARGQHLLTRESAATF